ERMEFAGWNLFEGCRVKNEVDPSNRIEDRLIVPNVTDVELQLWILVALADVVLLLLVTTQNAQFPETGIQKPPENSISKRPGAASYEQGSIGEHAQTTLPSVRTWDSLSVRHGTAP